MWCDGIKYLKLKLIIYKGCKFVLRYESTDRLCVKMKSDKGVWGMKKQIGGFNCVYKCWILYCFANFG